MQQTLVKTSEGEAVQGRLPSAGQIWKVKFERICSLLATSATNVEHSNICIWEQNPQGHWCLLSKIASELLEDNAGNMLE